MPSAQPTRRSPARAINPAVARLHAWAARQQITQRALAEVVGCHPVTICRVLGGQHAPSPALALRIEEATRGAVRAWDLAIPAALLAPRS